MKPTISNIPRFLLMFSILLLSIPVVAQTQGPTPGNTSEVETVISQVKKAVVFTQGTFTRTVPQVVNGARQEVTREIPLRGTAFFIWVPEPRFGEGKGLTFLVTNKHLLREPDLNGNLGKGPYFRTIEIRANTKVPQPDGKQFVSIPVEVVDARGSLSWLVDNQDDTVDLAITPVFNLEKFDVDYKTIQEDLFGTKAVLKEKHVDENDELLFTGLFASDPGASKNYPIVRHGKLARLSQERMKIGGVEPSIEVHLADVMSFGGNSGSPVLLRLGGVREGLPTTFGYSYVLLGVMQGYFNEEMTFQLEVTASIRGAATQNSGIAAIIPADKLEAILNSPRARAYRERAVATALAATKAVEAEECYRRSIDLLEKSAPEISDLATALEEYAAFLRAQKRPREAKDAEERAAKIRSLKTTDLMAPKS